MTMPAPGGGNNRQAQVTVTANVDPFTSSMNAASKAAAAFGTALKKVDDAIFSIMKRAGAAAMGGGALALFGDIRDLQAAAKFQTQLTTLGVQAGISGKQLTDVGAKIQGLTKTIPASTTELMQLATQLAAVGVNGTKQLATLTAQAERLAAATNTQPGALLTGLVQMGQSLGNSLQSTERYGSVLTSLQQQLGASAQDTLNFAAGISAVAAKAGMGQASILGFAGAFQKLGIDSASGAQAFNTIVNDMSDSVARGTTRMQLYASALNEPIDQFKKNFAANPAAEFTKFVDVIAAQGQRGGQTLDQFGLDGSRMIRVFASLSSGAANLHTALNDANSAYAQGDATAQAAAQAYDTFDNKLQLVENAFNRIKETIGAGFLPIATKATDAFGAMANGAAGVVGWINKIHIPVLGDWATKFGGIAAGVGLAAGAFGLFAASITKFLGVWRVLTGAIGGSAIRGLSHGMSRGSFGRGRFGSLPGGIPTNPAEFGLGNQGTQSFRRGMDPMKGASRTQLAMYRAGYGFGSRARRTGPMVDPEASRIGRNGLVRGGVGSLAMFPVTRYRQIVSQAKDTILHPVNAANRDPNATDPFSMYGGYQQMVRAGKNARGKLAAHLTRDGAQDWERNLGERVKTGFGDVEDSAARLRFDRSRLTNATWDQAHNQQLNINSKLTRSQAIELLHKTDLAQMATGMKDPRLGETNFDQMKTKDLWKSLKNQAVWTGDNAAKDAGKQFDEKLSEKETAKLANPFQKLATKVKEISTSLVTDTGKAFEGIVGGLKTFFENALKAVVSTAQKMYAEVVRLKALAGGATEAEANAAKAAKMPFTGPMYGPARPPAEPADAPSATARPRGLIGPIPATGPGSMPEHWVDPAYRGVLPEAVSNTHVANPERIGNAHDSLVAPLGANEPSGGQKFVSAIDKLAAKMTGMEGSASYVGPAKRSIDGFLSGLEKGRTMMVSFAGSVRDIVGKITTQYGMQLMLWLPIVTGALSGLASHLDQTARDTQFAGEEIQKALGRQWLSPTQMAQQQAQSNSNKADQNPWGATEQKDAKSGQFASDHADTIAELMKLGGKDNPAGTQSVLQQQINALVQQSNGAPLDDAGQQQIRQLLMVSGLSKDQQHSVMGNLDLTGRKNSGIYDQALGKIAGGGYFFNDSDLNKTMTAQAASDIKMSQNPAGAALMLLASNQTTTNSAAGTYLAGPGAGGNFANIANGLIKQQNNGTKDGDANHISPGNDKVIGPISMSYLRDQRTAGDINGLLDQLKAGNQASVSFGQMLSASFKEAGLQVDKVGHVSGDTAKALDVLKQKAGNVNAGDLQTASAVTSVGGSHANALYQAQAKDPNANVLSLLDGDPSTPSLTYQAKVHEWNQQMINDAAKMTAAAKGNPILDTNVGITSRGYIDGLKGAIEQLQYLQQFTGGPQSNDYKNLEALKQENLQSLSSVSAVLESPGQQMKDSADQMKSLLSGGVNEANSAQVVASQTTLNQQYAQGLSTLKQAYMNVHETHIQMQREQEDHQHQLLNSQRDYNRQVTEADYQYQIQQTEATYQYNYAATQRLYSFNEQIRSMKYSLANAFGNAGSMVQAQYTQGAQATSIGMDAQVKQLQDSQESLQQLGKMGLSGDAIRVLKLDDPTNVAQAKRYINDFANNPDLIKTFNDSIGKRLSITNAIAQDPNNSNFSELKRQFDKTASDASDEFTHAQQLSSDAFAHSMDQSAQSFQISMGDFEYQYNLQMSRTAEDMSRINEYISIGVDALTKWAKDSGIPGLQDVVAGMAAINDELAASTKAQQDFLAGLATVDPKVAALAQGNADAIARNNGHPLDENKNGQSLAGMDSRLGVPTLSGGFGGGGFDPSGAWNPTVGLPNTTGPSGYGGQLDSHGGLVQGGGNQSGGQSSGIATGPGFLVGIEGWLGALNNLGKNLGSPTVSTTGGGTMGKSMPGLGGNLTGALSGVFDALGNPDPKTIDAATDSIKKQVKAAGDAATANDAGKTATQKNTDSVKAQKDKFLELTTQLGYIPPGLQTLSQNLGITQKDLDASSKHVGALGSDIAGLPDRNVQITADTTSAGGALANLANQISQIVGDLINNVINNGLIAAWDYVVQQLGLSNSLNVAAFQFNSMKQSSYNPGSYKPIKGAFYAGGYTGDGGKYDPAGIVHAGEFVTTKEKTRRYRPLLEAIHSGELDHVMPGYAAGGAVATWPQLDAIRKQLFPASVLTSAYRPGAKDYHGLGEAIDIGVPGNVQSGLMPIAARLAQLYPGATELIHNPNGSIKNGKVVPPSFWGSATWNEHANHVHWAMTAQALQGAVGMAQAILDPVSFITSSIMSQAGAPGVGFGGLSNSAAGSLAKMSKNTLSQKLAGYLGSFTAPPQGSTGNGGAIQAIVQSLAAARGWGSGGEWNALSWLINAESGWNPAAANPTSSARGLFQKMTSINGPLESTVQGQTNWGLNYIADRYGDPLKAMAFHRENNWYAKGGIFDSAQTIGVGEAGPEAVLPLNSAGAQFMAQTLKASVGLMGGDPQLAQTLRSGRTAQYASPARSEMHVHHTDASTNFHGDITVVASDPNEMARKLAERRRMTALTRPMAAR